MSNTFFTDLEILLREIPEEVLFYGEHETKHPLATINTSYYKIFRSLKDFFESYKKLLEENPVKKDDKASERVLENYEKFLLAVRSHIDDCWHISKTFLEPNSGYKSLKKRNDLLEIKSNHQDFYEATQLEIASYKTYLDNTVNEIKHNNGLLCSFKMIQEEPLPQIFGYYVANVHEDSFQPVPHIHKEFRGCRTAFSYNYDILYNISSLFKVDRVFAKNLKNFFLNEVDLRETEQIPSEERQKELKNILEIEYYFFPDEEIKPIPWLRLDENGNLLIDFPSSKKPKKAKIKNMVMTARTDGHTKQFSLLYTAKNS